MLSDRDIRAMVEDGEIEISPFSEDNLTPNGYDLSIGEIYVRRTNEHVKEGKIRIPPLTWFAVSTKEFIGLSDKISAQLWIRSSYARRGIFASFGKVDAGFRGNLTIGCFNADREVELQVGDRFCQIVFELLESEVEKTYDKRSGHYQNQRGIRLVD
ncbi:MAG: dCTP deaminase [Thermoplasmata archaeon]|nr:MAG: dCTP deaminase [Thermoplasmata archaeon]